jgi:hypothetical protein
VSDEVAERKGKAHIRSMPSMMSTRIPNITIPKTMATTSMATTM